MKKINAFFQKYKHIVPLLLYSILYLSWFCYLEGKVNRQYRIIHVAADDYIPFCEVFVIPYFLWFIYLAAVIIYFFFMNKEDYYKVCIFLATGMTIFLIISTLWPNAHHLRPSVMPRDNIFTQLVEFLYRADTATNLWPSIHVYNSLGAHFAITHSKAFEKKKGIRIASLILASSIILSTIFIKQHSLFDVATAFILAAIMHAMIYRHDSLPASGEARNKKNAKPLVE